MATLQVTVRTYRLNGSFLPEEPGQDKSLQERFRAHIGDLPNRLVDGLLGVYDVQVSNDQIVIYYLPVIIPERTLDKHVISLLEDECMNLKLQLKFVLDFRTLVGFGRSGIVKKAMTRAERLTNPRRIKRLRHEVVRAIQHFIDRGDETSNAQERGDCHFMVRACVAELLPTLQESTKRA